MADFAYHKKTIRDLPVRGKRVLVRVDFNVPLTNEGKIADDTRIRGAIPTIKYLRERGAKVILMSHLGRPKGQVKPEFSLEVVAYGLKRLLDANVEFCAECVGDLATAMTMNLEPGEVLLLENLRFQPEEEANDPAFAAALASLGEIYVDDAFGTVHRSHASMEGVAKLLPAVSGLLLEKELVIMGKILEQPSRPFIAVLGGAKVVDKIGLIQNLLKKVDRLLIGGAMANTFLAASGYDLGNSKIEAGQLAWAKELLEADIERKICLPVDLVVAKEFAPDSESAMVSVTQVPADTMALDIGDKTILTYVKLIAAAKTIVWNGPMGVFEMPRFSRGTRKVALSIARTKGTTIVGGGDSIAALEKSGVSYLVSHISTGGGSTLTYLEGGALPGVEALANLELDGMDELADIEEF